MTKTSTIDILGDAYKGDLKIFVDNEDKGFFVQNDETILSGVELFVTICTNKETKVKFINPIDPRIIVSDYN